MWPAAYSPASRTSRTCGGSPASSRRASSSGSIASIRGTGRLLGAPGGHAAAEEAAHPQADRGEQLGRLQLVAVGGGDDDQLGVVGDDLGDLGREAGVVGGGADRAGDVGLVELLVGARVDRDGAGGDRRLEPARGQRRRRADRLDQRAAVERDDVLDVGRPVAERGDRVLDELGLVGEASARLWRRSKPIVEEVLRSIAGAAAERAAEVPRPDLDLVGQRQQPLVQGAEDLGRALARLDRQVGTGDVADEQRVAGQHRPRGRRRGRRRAAGRRCARDGARACGSPRSCTVAQLQRPAVGEGLVRVLGLGQLVDVDRRAGARAPGARGRRRGRRGCGSPARARSAPRAGGSGRR